MMNLTDCRCPWKHNWVEATEQYGMEDSEPDETKHNEEK